jgi:hypothetical protein
MTFRVALAAALAVFTIMAGCRMEDGGADRHRPVRLDTMRCAVRDPHTGIVRTYDYVIRVTEDGRALPYTTADKQ